MGEIADMMLDGTLCEGCGDYIGDAEGFPRYCSTECAEGRGMAAHFEPLKHRRRKPKKRGKAKVHCMDCGKGFKGEKQLIQHHRDAHGS